MNMSIKYIAAVMVPVLLLSTSSVMADSDGWKIWRSSKVDVEPVSNKTYASECGECHFAYQPGWLPARSWRKLMSGLDKHFGDNAELDKPVRQAILDYLEANAADKSNAKRSRKIMRNLKSDQTPLRISETRYIVRKHHELGKKVFNRSKDLRSLAQCDQCHTKASKGDFDEDAVRIPGIGRWDD